MLLLAFQVGHNRGLFADFDLDRFLPSRVIFLLHLHGVRSWFKPGDGYGALTRGTHALVIEKNLSSWRPELAAAPEDGGYPSFFPVALKDDINLVPGPLRP